MGFLSDVRTESSTASNVSKMQLIESQLGKKEFDEFIAALNDKSISGAAIQRVLKARGIEISENSVRNYRRKI